MSWRSGKIILMIRKMTNFLIIIGLCVLIADLIYFPFSNLINNYTPLPRLTLGPFIILSGIILRMSVAIPKLSIALGIPTANNSVGNEFKFWRNLIFVGFLLWLPAWFGVTFDLLGGTSPYGNPVGEQWISTIDTLFIIGLIGSIVSLVFAYFLKARNGTLAIRVLQLPFIYLVVVIGVFTYLQLLGV